MTQAPAPAPTNADDGFWRTHGWWPLACFALASAVILVFEPDRAIAEAIYFDVGTQHWIGTGAGDWWARALLHEGGRWLVRGIAAAALLTWGLSFKVTRLRSWRRASIFVFLAMVLATGLVGGLKSITNVDCPWDLAGYGGDNPYVTLFGDRPDALPRAKCFPGAHASSGFSLMCFYFALRDRSRRAAWWALAGALLVGVIFSIGQEARGAHFLSHDLTSAAIVWFLQLGLYAWFLKPRPGAA